MKRLILIIFCFALVFSLSACSNQAAKQITVAEAGYTCNAFIVYGENFSSNATVKAIGGGMFSVAINTPEDIAGLTFSFNNSEMSVSYNGLEGEIPASSEYGGFAEVLNEIFLKFTTSRPIVPYKDGEYLLEGHNSEYAFELTFNENGFPLALILEDKDLKVNFSNWMY